MDESNVCAIHTCAVQNNLLREEKLEANDGNFNYTHPLRTMCMHENCVDNNRCCPHLRLVFATIIIRFFSCQGLALWD